MRFALLSLKYYTLKILLSILWINLWFYVNMVILIEYSPVFFFGCIKRGNDIYGGETWDTNEEGMRDLRL